MADLTRTIEVKPLTLHIGAEISGVDLGRPLDAATRKAINDALLRWKVVFFREPASRSPGPRRLCAPDGPADHRTRCLRPYRGFPRDLLGRQVPHGTDPSCRTPAATVDRLAYGHHRRVEPSQGFHPARRDHSAVRRRHVLDQSRGGLPGPLGDDAWHRRRAARYPSFPGAVRYRQEPGIRRERPPPRDGDRAPDRARASRDGRAPPVRQSVIPEVDRRPHLPARAR